MLSDVGAYLNMDPLEENRPDTPTHRRPVAGAFPFVKPENTMTPARIAARLDQRDRENLNTVATALATGRTTEPTPWVPAVTISRCLKVALETAAEAARSGALRME